MGDRREGTVHPARRHHRCARGAARRAAAGALALAAVVATAAACGGDDTAGTGPAGGPPRSTTSAPATSGSPATTAAPTTSPSTTTTPAPTTTAPPPPAVPAVPATLRQGDAGPQVRALQQRLSDLGYWTGDADGVFGPDTHHAVVALQKAAGLGRDGIVGPATQGALDRGVRPVPHSHSGRVVEIDLDHQLLIVARDGRVELVFDTSTGTAAGSTPAGQWTVTREIDGLRRSRLGLLYRPKYFYEGVAVHGYTSVPPYPASHGCVRVTYPAMDHIWRAGLMPVGTLVLVY